MQFVNIHDAKTNLSKYLEQIQHANETIIICKNGQPIAQLCSYNQINDRKLGLWRGKVKIHKDFDDLPEDFTRNFE